MYVKVVLITQAMFLLE